MTTYIDLHRLVTDSEGKLKAECTPDGLHLNDAGYAIWRVEIIKAMKWL